MVLLGPELKRLMTVKHIASCRMLVITLINFILSNPEVRGYRWNFLSVRNSNGISDLDMVFSMENCCGS